MTNKKYYILLISSVCVLITAILLYVFVGPTDKDDPNKNKSDELKKYEALYDLELVTDNEESYYIIKGLTGVNIRGEQDGSSYNFTIEFPKTIDNIKVKKIVSDTSFTDYKYIKKIIIPEYVEYIGTSTKSTNLTDEPFISAYDLEEIEVSIKNTTFSSLKGVLYNKDKTQLLLYPQNINTNDSIYTIIDGVKQIGNYAFYSNRKLVQITFNSELEFIDISAFNQCSLLNKITFSQDSKLHTISNAAFSKCDKLTEVVLPSSVVSLGAMCFGNCKNLEELFIPSSIKTFGNEILGASLNAVITTSFDNIEYLKSISDKLGIKNKDKDSRIIVKE